MTIWWMWVLSFAFTILVFAALVEGWRRDRRK